MGKCFRHTDQLFHTCLVRIEKMINECRILNVILSEKWFFTKSKFGGKR